MPGKMDQLLGQAREGQLIIRSLISKAGELTSRAPGGRVIHGRGSQAWGMKAGLSACQQTTIP